MEGNLASELEGALIRRAQAGDRDAAGELLERRRARLASLVSSAWQTSSSGRRVPDDLLDWVVGELFRREVIAKYDPGRGSLETFLRTVVRNLVADYRRENAPIGAASETWEGMDESPPAAATAADPVPDDLELTERVLSLLRRVPVRLRVVVLLRLFEHFGDRLTEEERREIERASGKPSRQAELEIGDHVRRTPVKGGWSADHRFVARFLGISEENAMQIQYRLLREVRRSLGEEDR
jgi:DNA-directed RNA polymerase specialized sigma24 family protein